MTSLPECTDQVAVNQPVIVAEVRAAFARYETVLAAGDVAALNALFWDSPLSIRFGVADRQRGAGEIRNWRREHGGVPAGRRLHDTDVLTVDGCTPIVTALFDGPAGRRPADPGLGPLPPGWRIVSAHVSEIPAR